LLIATPFGPRSRPRSTRTGRAGRPWLAVSALGWALSKLWRRAIAVVRRGALSKIRGRPSAILSIAFKRRTAVIAAVITGIEPRPAVEGFEAVGGAQFDHITSLSRVAKLNPLVPEPGGLEERFADRVGKRLPDRGEFKTVGCCEPLIRPHRFLELPPLLVGESQHLLSAGSQCLAAVAIRLEGSHARP
jgi:hypothetical protein